MDNCRYDNNIIPRQPLQAEVSFQPQSQSQIPFRCQGCIIADITIQNVHLLFKHTFGCLTERISNHFIINSLILTPKKLASSGSNSSSGSLNPFHQFDTVPGIRLKSSSTPARGIPLASRRCLNFAPNDILIIHSQYRVCALLPSEVSVIRANKSKMNTK